MKEFGKIFPTEQLLVTGAASSETTYRLSEGVAHQEDTILTASEAEHTFGGAGVCNAVAFSRTGVIEDVSLYTVVGQRDGDPDTDALFMVRNLADRQVTTHLQMHEGPTEKTVIYLSGMRDDQKRGFRLADPNGGILRDNFEVNDELKEQLAENPIVVASSFAAPKVAEMARAHKELRGDDGLFIWTINKDTALGIAQDEETQETLRSGAVDIICMSEKERRTIDETAEAADFLEGVSLEVITRGKDGCRVIDRTAERHRVYHIPAFSTADNIVNDNGAGEAHHANFLATYLVSQDAIEAYQDPQFRARVLETAGNIANLAGYLKVQQPDSLWFPSIDYDQVLTDIMTEEHSPREIAERAYDTYGRRVASGEDAHTLLESEFYPAYHE